MGKIKGRDPETELLYGHLYRRGKEPGTKTDQGYYEGAICIYNAWGFNDPF